jgi:hypothetical protein
MVSNSQNGSIGFEKLAIPNSQYILSSVGSIIYLKQQNAKEFQWDVPQVRPSNMCSPRFHHVRFMMYNLI